MYNKKQTFESTIISLYGSAGKHWLQSLPATVTLLARRWHLNNLHPLENLSYNYVLAGTRDNNPIILKLGFETNAIEQESSVLNALAGPCVKLLEHDVTHNALLLEQALPGTSLKEYFPEQDSQAIEITCKLIKSFKTDYQKLTHYTAVTHMLTVLDKDYPALSRHLNMARIIRNELLKSTHTTILMHGDLHHQNILLHQNTWRVIDPKGVVGDPSYECAAYIHNPLPELLAQHNIDDIINNRIKIFSSLLKYPEKRIAQWSYAKALLAACWAIDDNLNPIHWLALCDIIAKHPCFFTVG